MILPNIRFNARRQRKHGSANSPYTLTQNDNPIDEHGDYLSHHAEPNDRSTNSQNLFDDSNDKNKKWLKIAKMHLAKSR